MFSTYNKGFQVFMEYTGPHMIINTSESNFNYTFQIPAENIGKAMKEHETSNSVAERKEKDTNKYKYARRF